MSTFWTVIGAFTLIIGVLGGLMTGDVTAIIVGAITGVLGSLGCFTASRLLDRVQYIADTVEEMAQRQAVESAEEN